jgi:hypothetical protein
LRPTLIKTFFATFALLLIAACAWAKPPTLEPDSEFPPSILPGHLYTFHLKYKQTEGDKPTALKMLIDAPSGQISVPAQVPGGDPINGIPVTWDYTPADSGQYQYHFEATSSTGGFARFPAENKELEFESPSLAGKYIALVVGLLVGLMFLPFVVYVGTRSVNKRSDPAAAARIALMIGVLASFGLFWYLFLGIYGPIGIAIGAIAAVAVLIALLSRRRTA